MNKDSQYLYSPGDEVLVRLIVRSTGHASDVRPVYILGHQWGSDRIGLRGNHIEGLAPPRAFKVGDKVKVKYGVEWHEVLCVRGQAVFVTVSGKDEACSYRASQLEHVQ